MTNVSLPKLAGSFLLLFASVLAPLAAQDRADPVAMGKARASVASARGLSAVASNPAGLDLPALGGELNHDLTFSLYNIGGTVGATYFSSSDFQQIFGKDAGWPNQNERARLGELLQDERLFANGANNLFVARYRTEEGGTFGLHYGHRVYARLNFPDEFTRVISSGELLAEQYRFINRGIGGAWHTELGLSYGKAFGGSSSGWFSDIGLGATLNFVQGVAQFEVNDNSYIAVDQRTVEGNRAYVIRGGYVVRSSQPQGFDPATAISKFEAALFPSTSGTGFSADVGMSGVLYRGAPTVQGEKGRPWAYFGMALQGVGSITWSGNTYERTQVDILDTLRNAALNNEQFEKYQGTLQRGGDYVTKLPSVFRAGLAFDASNMVEGTLMIDLEGELPLNDVAGNSTNPRLSLGGDWGMSPEFSLRAGLSGGGISKFGIGLGVGWRPLEWLSVDVGTSEVDGIFSGERLDLAFRLAAGF